MEGVLSGIGSNLSKIYQSVISLLPTWAQGLIGLFVLVVLIVIYSVIIWHGYRFISKKDPLNLNLNQYNNSSQPFFAKVLKSLLYFVEYLVISPLMIFLSFSIFTILLTFLTTSLSAGGVLLVSAAIIGAVRLTAYYKEDLSKEVAKFIPFTLLAVSVLNPKFFELERIFGIFAEIPVLINQAGIYLVFIILLEVLLRLFDFTFSLFGLEEENVEETD